MQLAIVAAGFTPGEADQLRRAMAAWQRKGGLEPFERAADRRHARARLRARVRRADLPADPGLRRVRLSRIALGELRAAGLRLGVAQAPPAGGVLRARCSTASRWASTRPSQLVQDARRHGVEVRPADVTVERLGLHAGRRERRAAVRLGLRMVGGLVARPARSASSPRARRAVRAVAEASRAARARSARDLSCLADAGALAALAGHRHAARTGTSPASRTRPPLLRDAPRSTRPRRAARADRRRGHRRRLPQPRPHAGPPSARAAARPLATHAA